MRGVSSKYNLKTFLQIENSWRRFRTLQRIQRPYVVVFEFWLLSKFYSVIHKSILISFFFHSIIYFDKIHETKICAWWVLVFFNSSNFRFQSTFGVTNQISKRGKCSNANFNRRMIPHLPNNFRLAAGENSYQGLASARCIILHGLKLTFLNG